MVAYFIAVSHNCIAIKQISDFSSFQILSISGDGKVLVWQMSPGSHDLKLVSGFILQTESVPRSMRLSKARGDVEIGGTVTNKTFL